MSLADIRRTLDHLQASLHTFKAGEIICNEGESFNYLCLLLKGSIQHRKSYLTGDCLTLHIQTAPSSLGEETACLNRPAPYTLYALEETTILLIKGENMLYMDAHSSFFMSQFLTNMMKLISKRNLGINTQSNYSRIISLKKRVATFLLEYYKETGQYLFTISLNRCEMAAYLNATRPALSKVLAELKKDDIIDYYKDSFKINDLEALMNQ